MQLSNLLNALPGAVSQGLIWGIMAIGVFITFKVLDIADLTVDGSIATGGAACIMLLRADLPVWVAMLGALAVGLGAGLITGLLHTLMGIPALLAGILTQFSLWSINLQILDGSNQSISVDKYPLLVSSRYINQAIFVVAIFVVVIIAILYWFFGTALGCGIRATGANPHMSRAQGININFTKVLGLMLSNGLVALSGGLLSQYQGFADIKMGIGSIVIGLAAVIIGEVVFSRIFRNFALRLLSVVLGAIIYYVVLQVIFWFGIDSDYLKLLTAVIVAIFLAIPYWKDKYFNKPSKKGGAKNA
ncbi:MAG: ABC transporter permease [Butyricicoccus sp.]|nr:ABC transporter permease [Butyricicoccus sp.]